MTPDGFLRTGDLATVDEAGFVRIVDRKKDMIIVSGFNVYPNELEDVVAMCAGVLEVGAFGVPDTGLGRSGQDRGRAQGPDADRSGCDRPLPEASDGIQDSAARRVSRRAAQVAHR